MEIISPHGERFRRDQELIHAALTQGDQKAYAELMRLYWNPVYEMMLKKSGDENMADDLTIEAFGKAFQNLQQYAPTYAFSTWLYKIATNNFIDHKRRSKRRTLSIDETYENDDGKSHSLPGIPCEQPGPEEDFIRKQKAILMHEIVDRLKPHY